MFLVILFMFGCVYFPTVYVVLDAGIYQYTKLFTNGRYVSAAIAARLVSSLQAIMAVAVGGILVRSCSSDVINDKNYLVYQYASFGLPYMIFDIYAMYQVHISRKPQLKYIDTHYAFWDFLKHDYLFVVHHLALAFVAFPLILWGRNEKGDFFAGCFLLHEMSTPFLHFRKIMHYVGWRQSFIYKVNDFILLVVYIVFRVLMFPFMYQAYGNSIGLAWWWVPFNIPFKCTAGCLIILAFQLYWLVEILKVAFKKIQGRKKYSKYSSGLKQD